MKRPHGQYDSADDFDSENIDPAVLPPLKKSKSAHDDIVQFTKSQFVLKTVSDNISARQKHPLPSTSRFTQNSITSSPPRAQGARVPASRSKLNSKGLKANRRKMTRVDPPHFSNVGGQGASLPFSLDNALSGTVNTYSQSIEVKNVEMLDDMVPKGWNFDIHEDTRDQEDQNLLNHSAFTLVISDEGRLTAEELRGKENIPPVDDLSLALLSNTEAPTSRTSSLDQPRTPLSDLDATEFYGEGLDVNSVYYIPAEKEDE